MENSDNKILCSIIGENPSESLFGYDEEYPLCAKMKYKLVNAIQGVISSGCKCFCTTLEEGAAMWGAEACEAIKCLGGDIEMRVAPISEEQANRWHPERRERYYRLIEGADKVITSEDEIFGEDYIFANSSLIIVLGDRTLPRISALIKRAKELEIQLLYA